ncbi:conserved hypothetical protein [Vibrio chagasii]|nr:conserved hypothetical protein [Vibrio chagasii]CAH6956155.1 conserved hypothetical protein [Vibrio chagasii]CAH7434970.1 conserved hypothetical protein [Vibrio chagasii]
MKEKSLNPEKITKPIQLLGAWLAGLFSINGSFLAAASTFPSESWQSVFLVVAAVLNVPIFLGAVFLLQTRFRPELQEDSYYSNYLNRKSNEPVKIDKYESMREEFNIRLDSIELSIRDSISQHSEKQDIILSKNHRFSGISFGLHNSLINNTKITDVLRSYGISSASDFGSLAPQGQLFMAISNYLTVQEKQYAIELASELELEGYSFFDNIGEGIPEQILIGAYGNLEHRLIKKSA